VKIVGVNPVILKSKFSQVLGWSLIGILLVTTTIVGFSEGWLIMLQTGFATLVISIFVHRLLLRPQIRVTESGVEIVNPYREFEISWSAIERIDTKWGLTLQVGNRKYGAWSAPAPGRHSSYRAARFEGKHLPESSYLAGTVRPGDLVSSDSGAAAYTIRKEWERRRDLGLLNTPAATSVRVDTVGVAVSVITLTVAVIANLI
jgi:hypothetical protein